jgi:hypothetical protein
VVKLREVLDELGESQENRKMILYILSEANTMGKEFVKLGLEDGSEIILVVDPYEWEVRDSFVEIPISHGRVEEGELVYVIPQEGKVIYHVSVKDVINIMKSTSFQFVELVGEELEDLLRKWMDK